MAIGNSGRARGGNRGGCGGGYEPTDPDWDSTRIRTLRAEYDSLEQCHRESYLKSLSKFDRWQVTHREER
jgi:hypothetical protein